MLEFRPPIDSPWMMALCKWGLPLELKRAKVSVRVVGDGLERLKKLRTSRAVLTVNHSDQYDPEAVFELSKMIGEDFHFIAARECFDWVRGSVGWWFQRLGCYSVQRGEADLESFKQTREIIAHGKRHLVLFPEGEVTRQPDQLMPLRRGALRLFFEGQEEILSSGGTDPVYVVPIGIRWCYRDDITPALHRSLRRIEERLGIVPESSDLVERTRGAGHAMLDALEQEYFTDVNQELNFAERVESLRGEILQRLAKVLNVDLPEKEVHLDWMRRVINAIEAHKATNLMKLSRFRQRLHKEQGQKIYPLIQDCSRVQRLIGVGLGKDRAPDTPERLAFRIAKLEREVLGESQSKGHRIAMVSVGEPINLMDYWQQFLDDKGAASEAATEVLSERMQKLIDDLDGPQINSDGRLPIEIASR